MLNLDTHILLFALTGQLRTKEREALSRDRWSISAIVPWEITRLARLARIDIDLDDPEIVRVLSRIQAWPIDLDVCRAIATLGFRSDPAEIAATSVVHSLPLVTRDHRIRRSRMVPLLK